MLPYLSNAADVMVDAVSMSKIIRFDWSLSVSS